MVVIQIQYINVILMPIVCVCQPLRLLITSGVMWHDKDPHTINLKSSIAVIWQLYSLTLMGVALDLIRVVETNPIRVS